MSTGIIKSDTLVSVAEESTEGVFETPGISDFVQPLEGFESAGNKELLERGILTNSIGKAAPKTGLRGVTASLPLEMKASGSEGAAPEADLLYRSLLGTVRTIASRSTTKSSGNTATNLEIEDADISKYTVNDGILVLESGEYHACVITAVATGAGVAALTISPALPSGNFSNDVEIAMSTVYAPADSGHLALSLGFYWANQIRQESIGCKPTEMTIENWTTGQLPSSNFTLEGLNFDRADAAAPVTPTYLSGQPPVLLSSCFYIDAAQVEANNFSLSIANTLGFVTDFCDVAGKTKSRVTGRAISGSVDPYMDDTTLVHWTKFKDNVDAAIIATAGTPSGVDGEFTLGSVIIVSLPQVRYTESPVGDNDGILTDALSFQAHRGVAGTTEEISISFI